MATFSRTSPSLRLPKKGYKNGGGLCKQVIWHKGKLRGSMIGMTNEPLRKANCCYDRICMKIDIRSRLSSSACLQFRSLTRKRNRLYSIQFIMNQLLCVLSQHVKHPRVSIYRKNQYPWTFMPLCCIRFRFGHHVFTSWRSHDTTRAKMLLTILFSYISLYVVDIYIYIH